MPTPLATLLAARVTSGHGQGKKIGVPTINIDPALLPNSLPQGIYACRVTFNATTFDGAMHYGPRPVFDDPSVSCEIHILDHEIQVPPSTLDLTIFDKVRDVQLFPSVQAMTDEIARDITKIRAILHPS
ncbi:MAG: riboflavin kinase [Candidatus Peribacteraceae bacterium]